MNNQQKKMRMSYNDWTESTGMLEPPILTVAHQYPFDWWADTAENIWITALEGGSTHWIDYIDTKGKDLKDGKQTLQNFPVTVYHGSEGWGEKESEVAHGTSLRIITKGIQLLGSWHIMSSVMQEDIDAEIADQIIQRGLFGELIYV